MTADSTLERIDFRPGQRLTAGDLGDRSALEARSNARHVREVHGTWGVAAGLRANVASDGKGIRVMPGMAYDCHGHLILVPEPVELRPPRDAVEKLDVAWLDLAVSHEAHFSWHVAGRALQNQPPPAIAAGIRLGEQVPLARVPVSAKSVGDPDNGIRRGVRALTAARVRGARIPLGQVGGQSVLAPLRWILNVSTAAEGFRRTPLYFARLDVARDVSDAQASSLSGIAGPFTSVQSASATGFTIRVHFGRRGILVPILGGIFEVVWIGVELQPPCPVRIDPDEPAALPGYPFEPAYEGGAAAP